MTSQHKNSRILKLVALVTFATFFAQSCDTVELNEQQTPIAKAYDKVLYWEDVKDFLPHGATEKDSLQLVTRLIDKWVKHTLKLRMAEQNLDPLQKDLTKEIEEYRSSLLIYKYEQEYIKQKLDTFIANKDIQNYYEGFKPELLLEEPVVLVDYVILQKDAPKYWTFKSWLRNNYENKIEDINQYCADNADLYFHHADDYMHFDRLLELIPLETNDPETFLRRNDFVELKDGDTRYLVKIFDYKLKRDVAPLNIVKNEIRSILLNKRKIELIRSLDEDVMNEAMRHNKIEIVKQK